MRPLLQCLRKRKGDSWNTRLLSPAPSLPPPFPPPLRGVQQGPIQKRGVVVVLEVIALLAQHRAVGGLVVGGDADGVRGVVEVDHVDVKHQHGRARDVP